MVQIDQPNAPVANVGPSVADLCRWAEDLCRRVAPDDLAGLPLYVLAQSAIRDTLGEARQTYGYTLVPGSDSSSTTTASCGRSCTCGTGPGDSAFTSPRA